MKGILFAVLLMTSVQVASTSMLCEGLLPPNDLKAPISNDKNVSNGMSERDFNEVLDRIRDLYEPKIEAMGKRLVINRYWSSDTVNAYAGISGDTYHIYMYGGLARYPILSWSSFLLGACHEIGHLIGGYPVDDFYGMSSEGQADYFASLKCFRQLVTDEEILAWARDTKINKTVNKRCKSLFEEEIDQLVCARAAHAGLELGYLFAEIKGTQKPSLDKDDSSAANQTNMGYADPLCRVDTYEAGAYCTQSVDNDVSKTDYRTGACEKADKYKIGFRPRCWFKPPGGAI